MKRHFSYLSFLICFGITAQAQNFLWAKGFGGTTINSSAAGGRIVKDIDNNIYNLANFNGSVDFDPGVGTTILTSGIWGDNYLQKLAPNGDLIWAIKLTDGSQDVQANSIDVDYQGGVYFTGYFSGTVDFDPGTGNQSLTTGNSNTDFFVLKLDSSGSFVWVKQFGSGGVDAGKCILIRNGFVYVAGNFQNTVDFDPGPGSASLTSSGSSDLFVLKLDTAGTYVWSYREGGAGSDIPIDIGLGNAGDIFVTATFSNNAQLLKLDNSGTSIWTKAIVGTYNTMLTIAGSSVFISGNLTNTQDVDPGGGTFNLTSLGLNDAYLLKLDLDGTFVWAKQFGGTDNEVIGRVLVNNAGDIHVYGTSNGSCDLDPGIQQYNFIATTGNNANDLFIVKLNSLGDFVWAGQIGNSEFEYFSGALMDDQGDLVFSGSFTDTVDFDFGAPSYNLNTTGGQGGFLLKISGPLSIGTANKGELVKVFPNPTSGKISIAADIEFEAVKVIDIMGKIVYEDHQLAKTTSFYLDLPNGVYTVVIHRNEEHMRSKIVVVR